MGNQQPSTLEDRITFLAKNAVFGDGYLWKHPETVNYKIIYTSTTPELLEVKQNTAPEIFATGIRLVNTTKHRGRYANAKPLYRLASTVHPIITEVKSTDICALISTLTLKDFALWYLDDGCAVRSHRKNTTVFSYVLCIGSVCNTVAKETAFRAKLVELFGNEYGRIGLNNSKATVNNKSWFIPKKLAPIILAEAHKYKVLSRKFPEGEGSTTIRKE